MHIRNQRICRLGVLADSPPNLRFVGLWVKDAARVDFKFKFCRHFGVGSTYGPHPPQTVIFIFFWSAVELFLSISILWGVYKVGPGHDLPSVLPSYIRNPRWWRRKVSKTCCVRVAKKKAVMVLIMTEKQCSKRSVRYCFSYHSAYFWGVLARMSGSWADRRVRRRWFRGLLRCLGGTLRLGKAAWAQKGITRDHG